MRDGAGGVWSVGMGHVAGAEPSQTWCGGDTSAKDGLAGEGRLSVHGGEDLRPRWGRISGHGGGRISGHGGGRRSGHGGGGSPATGAGGAPDTAAGGVPAMVGGELGRRG
jgi:hypothetical protein